MDTHWNRYSEWLRPGGLIFTLRKDASSQNRLLEVMEEVSAWWGHKTTSCAGWALAWKPDPNDMTLCYTVNMHYYYIVLYVTKINHNEIRARWQQTGKWEIYISFSGVFSLVQTRLVLTLPEADSYSSAGEIWSRSFRKAGKILFRLQNIDMALDLQSTVGKRRDYNIRIWHNVKVSTQNYILTF